MTQIPQMVGSAAQIGILGGFQELTWIVYPLLARDFSITRIILEEWVPRHMLLARCHECFGVQKVVGQVLCWLVVSLMFATSSTARISLNKKGHGLDDSPIDELKDIGFESVNAETMIDLPRELSPSVVNGTRIIAPKALEGVPAPFTNMHHGITPLYRGGPIAYWALVEGNRSGCGITVYVVEVGIDIDGILAQATFDPGPCDDCATYPYLQLGTGLTLLIGASRDSVGDRIRALPFPEGKCHPWSYPTLGENWRHHVCQGSK